MNLETVNRSLGRGTRRYHERIFGEYLKTDCKRHESRAREILNALGPAGFGGPWAAQAAWDANRYVPTLEGGAVLVFEASDPATGIVQATIGDPDNLSAANGWGLTNVTHTPNAEGVADRLTATATNLSYAIKAATNGSSGAGTTVRQKLTAELKYESCPWVVLGNRTAGVAAHAQAINLQAGTLGTTGSNLSNATLTNLGSGWWRCTFDCITFGSGTPGFTFTLQLDAAGTAPTAGMSILARNVIFDQTRTNGFTNRGSAAAWPQATVANQPGYNAIGFNGRPALQFYGAQYIVSNEAAVFGAFANNADVTLFYLANGGTTADQGGVVFGASNGTVASTGIRRFGFGTAGAGVYSTGVADDAGGGNVPVEAAADAGNHCVEWWGGALMSLAVDGIVLISNAASTTTGALTPTRSGIGTRASSSPTSAALINQACVRGVWAFTGARGAIERGRIRSYVMAYGGLS